MNLLSGVKTLINAVNKLTSLILTHMLIIAYPFLTVLVKSAHPMPPTQYGVTASVFLLTVLKEVSSLSTE